MGVRMDVESDMADRSYDFGALADQQSEPPQQQPNGPRTVLVLVVVFKFSLDKAKNDLVAIHRGLSGIPATGAMHGDRQHAWVLQTSYTAPQLIAHLGHRLEAGSIFNAWAFTPGADVACALPLDPLKDGIEKAWQNVRRFNAKRVTHKRLPRQFFEIDREIVEYGRRGTSTIAILDDHPLDQPAYGGKKAG